MPKGVVAARARRMTASKSIEKHRGQGGSVKWACGNSVCGRRRGEGQRKRVAMREHSLGCAFSRLNRHKLGADPRNLENVLVLLPAPQMNSPIRRAGMLRNSDTADLSIKERGDKDVPDIMDLCKLSRLITRENARRHMG
jgi:hypothetical protein